jgi:hypothetical protein
METGAGLDRAAPANMNTSLKRLNKTIPLAHVPGHETARGVSEGNARD